MANFPFILLNVFSQVTNNQKQTKKVLPSFFLFFLPYFFYVQADSRKPSSQCKSLFHSNFMLKQTGTFLIEVSHLVLFSCVLSSAS